MKKYIAGTYICDYISVIILDSIKEMCMCIYISMYIYTLSDFVEIPVSGKDHVLLVVVFSFLSSGSLASLIHTCTFTVPGLRMHIAYICSFQRWTYLHWYMNRARTRAPSRWPVCICPDRYLRASAAHCSNITIESKRISILVYIDFG